SSCSAAGQGAGFDAPLDRRRSAGHAELGADPLEVGLHRLGGDVEAAGYLAVAQPVGHQPQDVDLPLGQRLPPQPPDAAAFPGPYGADHVPGGAGVEDRLAAGGHPDLLPQLAGRDRLEQVAGGTGGHRRHQSLVVVGGEDQHPGVGIEVENRPQRFDAVEEGHRVVAEHDVGCLAGGLEGGVRVDEGRPVAHRPDDADAVVAAQPVDDGLEHQPVILGHHQSQGAVVSHDHALILRSVEGPARGTLVTSTPVEAPSGRRAGDLRSSGSRRRTSRAWTPPAGSGPEEGQAPPAGGSTRRVACGGRMSSRGARPAGRGSGRFPSQPAPRLAWCDSPGLRPGGTRAEGHIRRPSAIRSAGDERPCSASGAGATLQVFPGAVPGGGPMPAPSITERGWKELCRYTYVQRRYEEVWPWLAHHVWNSGEVLPNGGRSIPLRVRPAGVDVSRPLRLKLGGVVTRNGHTSMTIHGVDAAHPHLFPELDGDLEVAPVPNTGLPFTQIGVVARYRPPLGALGAVGDRLIGREVADAALTAFLDDLAEAAER